MGYHVGTGNQILDLCRSSQCSFLTPRQPPNLFFIATCYMKSGVEFVTYNVMLVLNIFQNLKHFHFWVFN